MADQLFESILLNLDL